MHCINLELLSIHLPHIYTYVLGEYKFKCFVYPA